MESGDACRFPAEAGEASCAGAVREEAVGQSGRPPARRNRATILAEQLLVGQAAALIEKAVERALAGDALALKLCLDHIMAPVRGRAVRRLRSSALSIFPG